MAPEILIESITISLNSIMDEPSIPKNIKLRIGNVVSILNGDSELTLKINKGLNELEEIGNGMRLTPYMRTQIWNIITNLENMLTLVQ